MVFSLHLVYLSTAACISEKNKVGSMLAQGFLRDKGQAEITKCYFLCVGAINMQSLSGHYLMRQQVPMVFLLLLVNCKKRGKWYTNHSSNKTNRNRFGSCWFSIFNNFLNIFLMPMHGT